MRRNMILSRNPAASVRLFWLSVMIFLPYSAILIHQAEPPKNWGSFLMPLAIYGFAHALRAVRLGVLLGSGRVRHLLGLYFFSAACSSVIPFKLGELVRVNEIAWWTGSYWRGLLIVWIERTFDVVALGGMAWLILDSGTQEAQAFGIFLWAIGGFVFLTVLFFFILPEQLCNLNLHVMRSYKGRKAVHILRILDSFYQIFDQVRPILAGKMVTLLLLTLFIWASELLAVVMLLDSSSWLRAMGNVVRQFSLLLGENGQALGLGVIFEDFKRLALITLGAIALIFYTRWRIQPMAFSRFRQMKDAIKPC